MGKVPRESSLIFFSRVPQRGSAPKKKNYLYMLMCTRQHLYLGSKFSDKEQLNEFSL